MERQLNINKQIFYSNDKFLLESGKPIHNYHLAYTTYGKLNDAKDNVIWVFHALTGNSEPHDWWSGLVGVGKFFDPAKYFIVCVNMPGSCYGSLSPLDKNPQTEQPYYHNFPMFTIRDMINTFIQLRKSLGINKIKVGLGGSMGGYNLLEWSVMEPDLFEYIIPIATAAKNSPWEAALNATQRMCIENDPTWNTASPNAGINGMKIARAIALMSYRNYEIYTKAQDGVVSGSEKLPIDEKVYKAESYQKYQGEKLAKRFNAFSYYFISKSVDSHDLSRDRGSLEKVLSTIKAKTMTIGISSDLLFPPIEQEFMAKHIPNAQFYLIDSIYGHDGFLLEFEAITEKLEQFINN